MRRPLAAFMALVATAGPVEALTADCIVLENFASSVIGAFPIGWVVRAEEGRPVYTVREEDGRRFLHATVRGLGIQAGVKREWDLGRYPVLTWSWRPWEFPAGADERTWGGNDSVLAIYLLVASSSLLGPRAVKYIWSEKVPVGTRLSSNVGLTQVRVLRSGVPAKKGEWVEERVNVRDDYKKYFDVQETPKPAGIAVLTDSDDTSSTAQGDYASFRACRQ